MPNNFTYRFSDRKHHKNDRHHHGHDHGHGPHRHHPGSPFLPVYPPYRHMPPWFWLLADK